MNGLSRLPVQSLTCPTSNPEPSHSRTPGAGSGERSNTYRRKSNSVHWARNKRVKRKKQPNMKKLVKALHPRKITR
ncbi:hypothetical protein chiPu_0015574 [Chiloscyllium punctatum]|uniref:Uncharacterized protein n=1 Tax=Chiloscyllium punctatum TaxID=137246 RepID=A0A401T386_CHIPU|nr:hypothetical protein [Chiloscyllium punctatum]